MIKIALVSMPWVENNIPLLGMASLKSYLEMEGFTVDCLYLNLLMFSRIPSIATALANNMTWSEWFFNYYLFGPKGTAELKEEFEDICKEPSFQNFLVETKLPIESLKNLLHADIPLFIADCMTQIAWAQYDLIGFSSVFGSHAACLKLSKEIKSRFPNKPIVFGGANVEGKMGLATLKGCKWIDYIINGEGEEALTTLARNIQNGHPYEEIPRMSFRKGNKIIEENHAATKLIDLNRLPVPDHRDFFKSLKLYGIEELTTPTPTFEASRGCWWGQKQHCTFCSFNGAAMAFRAKTVENVIRDIITLYQRHKINHLRASDNIMGLEHLREMMPRLAQLRSEKRLDWKFFFEIKANLNEAQIINLSEAGVFEIQAGIESLSTPILRLMRKGINAIKNIQTIKLGTEHGLNIFWNILWGFPKENSKEYQHMAQTALALTHLPPPVSCGPVRVERFSPYYFDWSQFCEKKPIPQKFYSFIYPRNRFRLEDIAYIFDFNQTKNKSDYSSNITQLIEVVSYWKKTWARNFFAYRQGMGFVNVYDSRPLKLDQSPQCREYLLEDLEALIFSFCRTLKGLGEILAACRDRNPHCEIKTVQDLLNQMVERRWFYKEGEYYLNLALPVARLPTPQRMVFDQMAALRKSRTK